MLCIPTPFFTDALFHTYSRPAVSTSHCVTLATPCWALEVITLNPCVDSIPCWSNWRENLLPVFLCFFCMMSPGMMSIKMVHGVSPKAAAPLWSILRSEGLPRADRGAPVYTSCTSYVFTLMILMRELLYLIVFYI